MELSLWSFFFTSLWSNVWWVSCLWSHSLCPKCQSVSQWEIKTTKGPLSRVDIELPGQAKNAQFRELTEKRESALFENYWEFFGFLGISWDSNTGSDMPSALGLVFGFRVFMRFSSLCRKAIVAARKWCRTWDVGNIPGLTPPSLPVFRSNALWMLSRRWFNILRQ